MGETKGEERKEKAQERCKISLGNEFTKATALLFNFIFYYETFLDEGTLTFLDKGNLTH